MRLNEVLATALYSSAALLGQVGAQEDDEGIGSSSTEIETSTTSPIERPTFTVKLLSDSSRKPTWMKSSKVYIDNYDSHPPTSKQISSNNSQTIGNLGGSPLTPRRKTPRPTKNGRMSASGPLRSPMYSKALKVTRVSL